jgi:hypothetical protein
MDYQSFLKRDKFLRYDRDSLQYLLNTEGVYDWEKMADMMMDGGGRIKRGFGLFEREKIGTKGDFAPEVIKLSALGQQVYDLIEKRLKTIFLK